MAAVKPGPDPDFPALAGNVPEQPLDGVIGVAAFVDVGGDFFIRFVGTEILERSFGHEHPPDVLIDQDVVLLQKGEGRNGDIGEDIPVRCDPVGRPEEDDGMGFGLVDGAVDLGEKADAVAHGDPMLGLPVMPLDIPLAIAGRSGIGLSVVELRPFDAGHVQLLCLVDHPETRIPSLLILEELESEGPLLRRDFRESELLASDRVESRRFGVAGFDGPERPVLEVDLNGLGPDARDLHLVNAFDPGVFFGEVLHSGLREGLDLEKEKNGGGAGDQPEAGSESRGHNHLLKGYP